MKNLILYINLIASHSLMYERSSTAPPPYLYRVLLEIHMSFTEPSERNSNSPLALQRAGPARAWRPRTGLFGKVFSPGLRRVKHGVVRNVKIRSMGNQSKFFIFITSHPTTFPEKTFIPAQQKPEKKTYTDFLSTSISQIVDPSEAFYDEDGLCYQEKIIFLSHVIGSCEIITIEEED